MFCGARTGDCGLEGSDDEMVNVVLLLVMLSIGVIVVMCLDFQWPRPFARVGRRPSARRRHVGVTKL